MADTHYEVSSSLQAGQEFTNTMRALADSWEKFTRLRGILIQTKDTDAVGDLVYAPIVARYGYAGTDAAAKNAAAAASFAEIDAAFGASNAALLQLVYRHL